MSGEPANSQELLHLWQAGESAAAQELFDRYVERLIHLARAQLSPRFSARIDPEDVVQSVYRSFFVHARQAEYVMRRSGDLWRLLAAITINKVRGQVATHQAAKRDVRREEVSSADESASALIDRATSRDHAPEEAVMLLEVVRQQLLRAKLLERQVLQMRLSGSNVEEIAREVQRSERTVRRCLQEWEGRLKQGLTSDE